MIDTAGRALTANNQTILPFLSCQWSSINKTQTFLPLPTVSDQQKRFTGSLILSYVVLAQGIWHWRYLIKVETYCQCQALSYNNAGWRRIAKSCGHTFRQCLPERRAWVTVTQVMTGRHWFIITFQCHRTCLPWPTPPKTHPPCSLQNSQYFHSPSQHVLLCAALFSARCFHS